MSYDQWNLCAKCQSTHALNANQRCISAVQLPRALSRTHASHSETVGHPLANWSKILLDCMGVFALLHLGWLEPHEHIQCHGAVAEKMWVIGMPRSLHPVTPGFFKPNLCPSGQGPETLLPWGLQHPAISLRLHGLCLSRNSFHGLFQSFSRSLWC